MNMKKSDLNSREPRNYLSPVINVFIVHMDTVMCASDMGSTTEEWEEEDLTLL